MAESCPPGNSPLPSNPNFCIEHTADAFYMSGFGWKQGLPSNTLVTCFSPYCRDCFEDYGMCAECEFFAINYFGTCVFYNAIPSSFEGKIVSRISSTLATCSITNCHVCATDDGITNTCYICKNTQNSALATDFYSDPTDGTCVEKSALPAGYGVDPLTYLVRPCDKPNCLECQDNYRICTKCSTTDPFLTPLAVTDQGFCTSVVADNLVGWGPDTSITTHKVYKRCFDPTCYYCQTSHTSCQSPSPSEVTGNSCPRKCKTVIVVLEVEKPPLVRNV
jgi:hypothetical protein